MDFLVKIFKALSRDHRIRLLHLLGDGEKEISVKLGRDSHFSIVIQNRFIVSYIGVTGPPHVIPLTKWGLMWNSRIPGDRPAQKKRDRPNRIID